MKDNKLVKWLERKNLNHGDFALEVDVDPRAVLFWIEDAKRKPQRNILKMISRKYPDCPLIERRRGI